MSDLNFWMRLILAVLATWRITHLLSNEDGPADLIVRLRARLGNGFAARLMDCFQCLSLWVAAPIAFFVSRRPLDLLLTWLAISGAACLLERIGQEPVIIQPLSRAIEGGTDSGLLRTEPGDIQERYITGSNAGDTSDTTPGN